MSETRQQTIWREGDRIRRTDGTGYSDRVTDDQIRKHIASHATAQDANVDPDSLFVPFAEAVLAIRAFERATW